MPDASRPTLRRDTAPGRGATSGRGAASAAGRSGRGGLREGLASRGQHPSGCLPIALGALALACVVGALLFVVLSGLHAFVITGIDARGSEHVSADTVAKLANVEEGTTLLNVDVDQVRSNVQRNPWVKNVSVSREFPDTLGISVEERTVFAVVLIGSGSSVWALGDDGVWIEPVQLDTSSSSDVTVAALAKAEELGCLLITNVPSSVDPAQGSESTDATIQAVLAYQQQLPDAITSQAKVYYAASAGSTSLVLASGLEISLGSPSDIAAKAQALTELMNSYPNQLTYVNVRVPSKPTYRRISGDITLSGASEVVAEKQAEAAATADAASTSAATTDSTGSSG